MMLTQRAVTFTNTMIENLGIMGTCFFLLPIAIE